MEYEAKEYAIESGAHLAEYIAKTDAIWFSDVHGKLRKIKMEDFCNCLAERFPEVFSPRDNV